MDRPNTYATRAAVEALHFDRGRAPFVSAYPTSGYTIRSSPPTLDDVWARHPDWRRRYVELIRQRMRDNTGGTV